jgi:DNA-binding transcriptional MerR regulator
MQSFPQIEVKDINGFVRLADSLHSKIVFKTESPNGDATHNPESDFLIIGHNVCFKLKSMNYKNLDDYEDAVVKGFPNSVDFYEARKGNFFTYKEFDDCRRTGIVDRTIYQKAAKLGFVDNFDKFMEKVEKNKNTLPANYTVEKFDTSMKIYEYAISKGFKDYGDFDKAFFLGFADQFTYDEAKSKGFTYAEDYFAAVKMGFASLKEFQEAKHLKMTSKFEYDKYNQLKNSSSNGTRGFDEVQLLKALKTHESKKLPLKKIKELLAASQEEFMFDREGVKKLPEWYSQRLNAEENLILFLSTDKELKDIGFYDKEGEYFEVSRVSNDIIYLDGSNVAYNSANREDKNKPKLKNIKLVAEELIKLRYKEIRVIADASLRHKLEDKEELGNLKKIVKYMESPANTSADEFLMESLKKLKCHLISNDTYREWKIKDVWVAENIDKLRIPFMIDSGKVTLSGIDRLIKPE